MSTPAAPRPDPTAPAVQAALHALTPHLRLSTLLNSLQTLSQTLHEAQSHTAPFTSLHQRLQRITLTTTRLADRTAATLAAFRHAATASLDNLDLVHDLLRDDLPSVAASLLTGESATAARLAAQSRSLALQFDTAATALSDALSHATETRAACEARRAALAARIADRWLELRRARASISAAEGALAEATRLHDAAEEREAAARFKGTVLQAANVAAMVGSVMSTRSANLGLVGMGSAAALASRVDAQVLRAREERAVHLRQRQDARRDKLENAREAAELEERLRAVREEETLAEDALAALGDAVEALRTLAGVMLHAETFWSAVGEGCRGGGVDSVLGLIKSGGALGDDDRLALWESPRLRTRTGAVQAHWVALQSVCDECISGLGDTRKGMYASLASHDVAAPVKAEPKSRGKAPELPGPQRSRELLEPDRRNDSQDSAVGAAAVAGLSVSAEEA